MPPKPNKGISTSKTTSKQKLITRRAPRDTLKRVRQELDRVMKSIPDMYDIENALQFLGAKLDKLQSDMEGLSERMDYIEDQIDLIHAGGMESRVEHLDEKLYLLDQEVTMLRGLPSFSDKADGLTAGAGGQGA